MGILVLLAFYATPASSAPGVGRWAPLLREGLLFGSYKDHHTRSVGLEHPVETFRFVRTEDGGVATVGSGSGRNEYFVRPDGVLQHVHAEGITAELRGEGEEAEFVWSHGYKSAAFPSDKPPKVEVPDCTLVKAHAAESVKLLPEVAQALRAGRTTPLLLASPPGYAIVPKTDEPQRIDEWGVNYQQLGIGPASEALQAKMRGKFLLSQHRATRDYVLDVPFATYKVHCEGEHGKLPLAVISWDDRSRNLDETAPRTFVVNADNSISPTKATHLAFGIRGALPAVGAQMAELKMQAGGKPTVEDADLDVGSTPSHGNPPSTNDLNSELNNVARNTDDTARARALVKAGADLRSTNGPTWRHTPLHQAAYHGRYEMAKTLVELGAPLDLHSNPCGRGATGTPLELARGGGHHQIADMLEKAASGKQGRVVRLFSNLLRRINPRVAQLAPPVAKTGSVEGRWEFYQNIDMAYQGDVEIIDDWRSHTSIDELKTIVEEKGYSAISVGSFGFAALKSFDYQLTKEHCKPSHGYTNELHIWFPSVRGSRPLPSGEAAKSPNVPAGFHFHEGFGEATRGDQIGHITSGGVEGHCFKGDKLRWPLQWAAMIGDVEAIDALIAAGHDPNVKMSDWYDSEPLGWAASFGQCKAIEALCAHGADPGRSANLAGYTPLSDAQREGHTKAIALLNEYLSGSRTIGPHEPEFADKPVVTGKPVTSRTSPLDPPAADWDSPIELTVHSNHAMHGNGPIQHILQYDTGSFANFDAGTRPWWVIFDAGKPQAVGGVEMAAFVAEESPKVVELLASDDLARWDLIATLSTPAPWGTDAGPKQWPIDKPHVARYWKINVTDTHNGVAPTIHYCRLVAPSQMKSLPIEGVWLPSPVTAHSLVLTGVACFLTGWLAARHTYRT